MSNFSGAHQYRLFFPYIVFGYYYNIMVRQHLDERVSSLSGCYIRERRGADIGTMDAF